MKAISLISGTACLLLAFAANSAFAHHGNACVQEAEVAKTSKERTAMLKNCVAEEAMEDSVKATSQMQKEERCQQNSKNLGFTGDKKSDYLVRCFYANDFEKRGPDGKPLEKAAAK
ncbi:MAG: hypothetical protein WCI39_02500 [Gallionellaceae bacterium]